MSMVIVNVLKHQETHDGLCLPCVNKVFVTCTFQVVLHTKKQSSLPTFRQSADTGLLPEK